MVSENTAVAVRIAEAVRTAGARHTAEPAEQQVEPFADEQPDYNREILQKQSH